MHNQLLNTNKIISNIFFYFLTPLFICSWFRFFWIPLSHLYSCVSLCSCFVFYYLSGINLAASPFCLFWLVPDESLFFSLLFSIAVCQKRKSSSSVCLMVRSALSFLFIFFLKLFFCPSSLRVFARPALPLPSLFHFFFLLCRDALGVVYGNFCWIFPNSYNIPAFPSSGSATKTI